MKSNNTYKKPNRRKTSIYYNRYYTQGSYNQRKRYPKGLIIAIVAVVILIPAALLLHFRAKSDSHVDGSTTEELDTNTPRVDSTQDTVGIIQAVSTTPFVEAETKETVVSVQLGREGEKLTQRQQNLYGICFDALRSLESTIEFNDWSEQDFEKAYTALLEDYPEFFWVPGGYMWTTQEQGMATKCWVEPYYSYNLADVPQMREYLQSICDDIIYSTSGLDTYHQVLFIHDYIVNNTTYDYATYMSIENTTAPTAGNAYGCLADHLAVCAGYSAAFQLLLNQIGVECFRVTGTSLDTGEAHEWNCINLGGDYYYVDVTWDDPLHIDGTPETLEHDNFCITTAELLETHVIDYNQVVPECTATWYDYYRMNGEYYEYYDAQEIGNAIRNCIERGDWEISFKFASSMECDIAVHDLFDAGEIFELTEVTGQLSYQRSNDGRVLKIMF